ncbi:hypothetical protein [Aliiroseovarius marinus]|uniref:hypothetical protein n=1 Tax=Aliiroseovarius marinus TaxID=2500159 RepID=UPI0024957A5F|nr:hypothetical protein [Aliiroseovarius marinus]
MSFTVPPLCLKIPRLEEAYDKRKHQNEAPKYEYALLKIGKEFRPDKNEQSWT